MLLGHLQLFSFESGIPGRCPILVFPTSSIFSQRVTRPLTSSSVFLHCKLQASLDFESSVIPILLLCIKEAFGFASLYICW